MLKDEQASELLTKCETLLERRLEDLRGRLADPTSRAAAVWEMLVLDAASYIGDIQRESLGTGVPDVLVRIHNDGLVWLEATFIHPRFAEQQRLARELDDWIVAHAKKNNISVFHVSCELHENPDKASTVRQRLPLRHERKIFLNSPEVRTYFKHAIENPMTPHSVRLSTYDVTLVFAPQNRGPFRSTLGGPALEFPRAIKDHSVFRKLKGKATQHDTDCPHVVCVGADQGHALSSFFHRRGVALADAVREAFRKHSSLSAAVLVKIEDRRRFWGDEGKRAVVKPLINSNAKYPLSAPQLAAINSLRFDRWKYYFSLEQWERTNTERYREVSGQLTLSPRGLTTRLEFPRHVLIDSLAGRTNLLREYDGPGKELERLFSQDCQLSECNIGAGNLQAGQPPTIIMEITHVPPATPIRSAAFAQIKDGTTFIDLPTTAVVDCLTGTMDGLEEAAHDANLRAAIRLATKIDNCRICESSPADSSERRLVLQVAPPYESVYWPRTT